MHAVGACSLCVTAPPSACRSLARLSGYCVDATAFSVATQCERWRHRRDIACCSTIASAALRSSLPRRRPPTLGLAHTHESRGVASIVLPAASCAAPAAGPTRLDTFAVRPRPFQPPSLAPPGRDAPWRHGARLRRRIGRSLPRASRSLRRPRALGASAETARTAVRVVPAPRPAAQPHVSSHRHHTPSRTREGRPRCNAARDVAKFVAPRWPPPASGLGSDPPRTCLRHGASLRTACRWAASDAARGRIRLGVRAPL